MTDSAWAEYAEDHQDAPPAAGSNAKAVLETQVNEMWEAEKEVAALEAKLKEAKERLRKYSEETIPNTLEDMGLEEVTVTGGLKVKIRTSVHASPKKENREAVYDWLEKHGHGGLIKRHAIFTVGRDNERQAKSWIKRIKAFPGLFERKVESATLRSFVNQSIEEGTEIPMELFGAYTRRVAEVKSG